MAVIDYDTVNGRLIGEEGPSGRIDYQVDALGSVVGTMDSSGSAQKVYRYKPYGAVLNDSGPGAEPTFRWVGAQGYRYSGLMQSDFYVTTRHFGSSDGQWTTVDTLWPTQAAYAYAWMNPISRADQSGLAARPITSAIPCCLCADSVTITSAHRGPETKGSTTCNGI